MYLKIYREFILGAPPADFYKLVIKLVIKLVKLVKLVS